MMQRNSSSVATPREFLNFKVHENDPANPNPRSTHGNHAPAMPFSVGLWFKRVRGARERSAQ